MWRIALRDRAAGGRLYSATGIRRLQDAFTIAVDRMIVTRAQDEGRYTCVLRSTCNMRIGVPRTCRRRARARERLAPASGRHSSVSSPAATRRIDAEHSLEELAGLADAAGARVVLRVLQERPKPDSATFLGSGKVDLLARAAAEADVDVVIFDNELSPAQLRELQKRLERKVVDRTQLILDIFARRARTREGKLQVELAQLKYLLPRLVGAGPELSRLGGGIGTRGPGETKLETDRRRIRDAHPRAAAGDRRGAPAARRSCASGARRPPCRRWRSSATPTPARRRCSTG